MVRMTGYIPTLEQVDELHHRIAPSDAAYNLIHRHCVIVARIARALARRQNALFTRRCTLPQDAAELAGRGGAAASDANTEAQHVVPPSDNVIGGKVPPRLIDEHLVVIGGLLQNSIVNEVSKIPLLGDIPILGALARSKAFKRGETELVIIATAYISEPVDTTLDIPNANLDVPNFFSRMFLGQNPKVSAGPLRPADFVYY